jgi:hypothetical protein
VRADLTTEHGRERLDLDVTALGCQLTTRGDDVVLTRARGVRGRLRNAKLRAVE